MQSSNKPICTVIIENNKKEKKLFHTNVCRLLHFNTICSWFEPLDLPRYLPGLVTACGHVTVLRNKEDEWRLKKNTQKQLLLFVYFRFSQKESFKNIIIFFFFSFDSRWPHPLSLCLLFVCFVSDTNHQKNLFIQNHIYHIYI